LLKFIALNSPTLIDAMTNIQRFYKVGREKHDYEIERYGPHVAFRFRVADSAPRRLRHTSEYVAASVVRGCRDLACQATLRFGSRSSITNPRTASTTPNFSVAR
jgi:hypothetical protein